ncbi:MAG TPA: O-methyltransferase [Polyangiaceae bacterium]|jgi:predicted O-methyltransferase YrrM
MKHKSDDILHAVQARYLEALEPPREALLAKMEALAAEKHQPISDPEVASFLAVTIRSMNAKRAIELGTNIGYGAIVMARAGAHVTTIEKSAELCETARDFARQAGLEKAIDVVQGDAIAELEKLGGPFDLAYVDCVKEDYPRYLELLAPRLRTGGVVVADNVLWRGLVASDELPADERARVTALRAFNRAIVSSPFRGVVLPLGDGVAYAVKL